MPSLACRRCGNLLTFECGWGNSKQRDETVGDGQSPVPNGVLVRLDEDRVPVYQAEKQIGTHLYSPEGAIAVHPESVRREAIVPAGIDNGCCGSSGSDGPNRSCTCGNVVATEWSDCWTWAEVRFLPDAVVEAT